SAGPSQDKWQRGLLVNVPPIGPPTFQDIVVLPGGAFRLSGAVLSLGDREIGALIVGTSLDERFARELAALAGADVVITVGSNVVASTLATNVATDLVKSGGDARST